MRDYLPYSYAWPCSLCEASGSFVQDLSLENYVNSYLCFWLTLLHLVLRFFFLQRSPLPYLCMVFHTNSYNIDEVLLINPSAAFVFGDFSTHHMDWLTYSERTDRPDETMDSISNDLIQMVKLPALTVLLFWIYFFFLTLIFVLQLASLNWNILIMLILFWSILFLRQSSGSLELNVSAGANEFCEWFRLELMYIFLNVHIGSSLISMVFSCLCCCHSS